MEERRAKSKKTIIHSVDGSISWRRALGTLLVFIGTGLIVVSQFQAGEVIAKIAPGVVLLIAGGIFWGLVTVQNLLDARK